MAHRYDFRTTAGHICCQADSFDLLCSSCKQRDRASRGLLSSAGLRGLQEGSALPPPAPSLVERIQQAATTPRAAAVRAPVLRPVPPPEPLRAAAVPALERFPCEVSLIDNIIRAAVTRRASETASTTPSRRTR